MFLSLFGTKDSVVSSFSNVQLAVVVVVVAMETVQQPGLQRDVTVRPVHKQGP